MCRRQASFFDQVQLVMGGDKVALPIRVAGAQRDLECRTFEQHPQIGNFDQVFLGYRRHEESALFLGGSGRFWR